MNNSSNYGNDSNFQDYYDDADIKVYDEIGEVISFTLSVVIVTLNVVVLAKLLRQRGRCPGSRKPNRLHFFIIHLAIADLLVGVVCVLGDGITSYVRIWYLGNVMCKLYRFLAIVLLSASNNLLIGMSADRFLAVAFPMRTLKSRIPLGRVFVTGAWGLSVVVSVFFLVYARGQEVPFGCEIHLPESWWKPYLTIVAMVIYIVPALAISGCYIGICLVVWRNWKKGLGFKTPKITVIQAFFLCWTPYFIYNLLDVFQVIPFDIGRTIILGKLYPLNSAANPLIFILFNWQLFYPRSRPKRSAVPRPLMMSRSTTSLNILNASNTCIYSLSSSNQTLNSGV